MQSRYNTSRLQKVPRIQNYEFDEDDEIDQLEEQRYTVEEEQYEESRDIINGQFDEEDEANDTDEINNQYDPQRQSDSTISMKLPQLKGTRQRSEQSQFSNEADQ